MGNKKIINVSKTLDIREFPEGKSLTEYPDEQLKWLIKKAIDRESTDGYSFEKSFNEKITWKNRYCEIKAQLLFKQQ